MLLTLPEREDRSRSERSSLVALRNVRKICDLGIEYRGGHNTLDDLGARYGVDRSRCIRHGALLDAELLAAVYVELATNAPSRVAA